MPPARSAIVIRSFGCGACPMSPCYSYPVYVVSAGWAISRVWVSSTSDRTARRREGQDSHPVLSMWRLPLWKQHWQRQATKSPTPAFQPSKEMVHLLRPSSHAPEERVIGASDLCDHSEAGESVRGEFRVWSEAISAGSNPAGKEGSGP